jgi:hypothetical protein
MIRLLGSGFNNYVVNPTNFSLSLLCSLSISSSSNRPFYISLLSLASQFPNPKPIALIVLYFPFGIKGFYKGERRFSDDVRATEEAK